MTNPRDKREDDLAAAFRSVRDSFDGTHDESNTTLQRALFRTRKQARKQKVVRWFLLPAAAVLVASTAFAGATGRMPTIHSVLDTLHTEGVKAPPAPAMPAILETPTPTPPPTSSTVSAPPEQPVIIDTPPPPPPSVVAPPTRIASAHSPPPLPLPLPVIAVAVPAPTSTASASDPNAALFAEAHRIHFTEKDPARAIVAWDRYIDAAPNGRFAPEARYNRAIALVRLGRRVEAQTELAAFANGTYGDYRREDAKALLEAIARNP